MNWLSAYRAAACACSAIAWATVTWWVSRSRHCRVSVGEIAPGEQVEGGDGRGGGLGDGGLGPVQDRQHGLEGAGDRLKRASRTRGHRGPANRGEVLVRIGAPSS